MSRPKLRKKAAPWCGATTTPGFQQIKLYTFLTPDVIRAITAEAHRLGMTVTGHVPPALNAFQGVEAGMDQINHLNYVTNMMRHPAAAAAQSI